MIMAFASSITMLIACRPSYGSWPWEYRKTWYWTRDEIQYLRDVQENNRRGY